MKIRRRTSLAGATASYLPLTGHLAPAQQDRALLT
jgi:hypothetical protein